MKTRSWGVGVAGVLVCAVMGYVVLRQERPLAQTRAPIDFASLLRGSEDMRETYLERAALSRLEISGQIVDHRSTPIRGAAIQAGAKTTRSDANGHYALSIDGAQRSVNDVLEVRHDGFFAQRIDLAGANGMTQINAALLPMPSGRLSGKYEYLQPVR
mgnify:CR=1 FL=1